MPTVDPDPAGMGTYLVSAVLLALGIAIFLYILISEARAHRGQEQDGREAAAETGAAPGSSSAAGAVARPRVVEEIVMRPPLAARPTRKSDAGRVIDPDRRPTPPIVAAQGYLTKS
jgi:hypothetical protein